MIMRLLLFVKHHLTFIWKGVEFFNGRLFQIFYRKQFLGSTDSICQKYSTDTLQMRLLQEADLKKLSDFFKKQPAESYQYFKPHGFELQDLEKIYRNPAFMMFGVFKQDTGELCGYFMMRFFVNRKCFVGFLVDVEARGQGIAGKMGRVMLDICWDNHFTALATVSRKNEAAIQAYRKLNNFSVQKELPNDYICIKYEKEIN